jgi:hypothetical protein
MEIKEMCIPEVGKISELITALSGYAIKNAREQWAQNPSSRYQTPYLGSWGACAWQELAKDRHVVNYLLSDSARARTLMRSIHFCMQWFGQTEIDRLHSMNVPG